MRFITFLTFSLALYLGCQTKNNEMPINVDVGEVTFSQESDCFETTLTLNSQSHSMTICDFKEAESSQAKMLALKLKTWLEENLGKSKEYAASKLVKLKNENWLSEHEEPINQNKFIETIEFDGINAFSEGGLEIYFKDHGLFGGHTIIVDVNEGFEFEDAKIAG